MTSPVSDGTKPKHKGKESKSEKDQSKLPNNTEDDIEEPITIDQYLWLTKRKKLEEIGAILSGNKKYFDVPKKPKYVKQLDTFRKETEKEISKIPSGFTIGTELQVYLHEANITKLKVDAIVNAANANLYHAGGVARAIEKAAGDELTDDSARAAKTRGYKGFETTDVIATRAGKLPCSMVLHAVGPMWSQSSRDDDCVQKMQDVFSNVLAYADLQKVVSLAIPPISSGIYGVPEDVVSASFVSALVKFARSTTGGANNTLREVHFVDISPTILRQVAVQIHLYRSAHIMKEEQVTSKLKVIKVDGKSSTKSPGSDEKESQKEPKPKSQSGGRGDKIDKTKGATAKSDKIKDDKSKSDKSKGDKAKGDKGDKAKGDKGNDKMTTDIKSKDTIHKPDSQTDNHSIGKVADERGPKINISYKEYCDIEKSDKDQAKDLNNV